MPQFSLYHATEEALYKATCLLAEKSYSNNFRLVLLAPNLEIQELLNNLLWTYSQKQFIPHGSALDPLPEKQPIYITQKLENPNNAVLLVIIAPFNVEEIFANQEYIQLFQRIIIIYDAIDYYQKIIEITNKLSIARDQIDCYKQNPNGSWTQLVF